MLSLRRRFGRRGRRAGAADSPEVQLVRFLSEQVSVPRRAGSAMNAVSAFFALDHERQIRELPHVYLILEQYLTEVDPVRRLPQAQLRELVRAEFPSLARSGPLQLIFESPERQEILICREFLLAVLERTLQVLGGDKQSPLRTAKTWLLQVPDAATEPVPFDAADHVPTDPAAWVDTLLGIARGLHGVLDRSLGQASDRIYDGSFASVAHSYGGLDAFPIVIRLLPEGLLDEQRIQSLSRHSKLVRVQGALSDARRSALESASQLQAVLNTIGEGILTVDGSGRIVLANREVERLFGYEGGLIGESVVQLFDPDDPAAEPFIQAFTQGEAHLLPLSRRIQARGRRLDDHTFPLELTMSETRISEEVYYTAALQDVTIRVEYERGLVAAKEHAEEMDRLKTSFIANISHELRTPLTGILGSAQLLADDLTEEQREFTHYIVESGQRLLDTLSAILEFAQLDSGTARESNESIPVPAVLRRIADQHLLSAEAKGLVLALEVRDEELFIEASPTRFNRLIEILLGNAIKFTRAGSVTLVLDRDDSHALIHVRDTGIGIAQDFLPHLFQEFRQESDGLSRTHEGPGLGLAIARRIVENMGGTISADSTKGVGSTFTVRMPLMMERAPAMVGMPTATRQG